MKVLLDVLCSFNVLGDSPVYSSSHLVTLEPVYDIAFIGDCFLVLFGDCPLLKCTCIPHMLHMVFYFHKVLVNMALLCGTSFQYLSWVHWWCDSSVFKFFHIKISYNGANK